MKIETITIVIPALNEEEVIARTVSLIKQQEVEISKHGLSLEILVVDNGSNDNTAKEAERAGGKVIFEPKKGYGNALRRGFSEASGEIIVMGDADLTYPLETFWEFVQPLINEDYDVVIGNRYHQGIEPNALKFLNKAGGQILSALGNLLFGVKITDWHCGMRAFTKSALTKMELKSEGMELASEIVIKSKVKNLRIKQTKINYRRRLGTTKLNVIRDGWRHVVYITKSYFHFKKGIS